MYRLRISCLICSKCSMASLSAACGGGVIRNTADDVYRSGKRNDTPSAATAPSWNAGHAGMDIGVETVAHFANALRDAGAIVNHAFVVFFYGVFPGAFETLARMDISLHHLCTWWDVLEACKDRPAFSEVNLKEVRRFLEDPVAWSAAHGGISSPEEAMARKAAADA